MPNPLPPDFSCLLELKDAGLIDLFRDLRVFIHELYPEANELLYHTHALTSVFSVSEKLGDAYCMIPVYARHLNLGFNKGSLLPDPNGLLQGTGKLIRHIPIQQKEDYRNERVVALIREAINLALKDREKIPAITGTTISKIKHK